MLILQLGKVGPSEVHGVGRRTWRVGRAEDPHRPRRQQIEVRGKVVVGSRALATCQLMRSLRRLYLRAAKIAHRRRAFSHKKNNRIDDTG
jgi:hypothetical protein